MNTLRILLLALFPVSMIYAEPPPGKPNLLENSNFEKGTAGWELLNWGKNGKMEIDTDELHDGKPTLRVENFEPCHSFIRQIVAGKPNTRYRLIGYIKTKNVESAQDGKETGAVLEIGRTGIYTPMMENTEPWTKVTVEFTTKDTDEIRVGPSLGTDPVFVTGTAWFADLSLVELGDASADAPYLPFPEKAKTFLDPVEMLLKSAPASAIQKLRDDPTAQDAMSEINQYFGKYAINKSIILHTTVEAAEAHPRIHDAFRIRAASVPLEWDGGTMKRLSWLYFQPADGPGANSVKLGSEITVVGWVRRCEVVKTQDGPRLNFDLQYSKIESSSKPLP